MEGIERKQDGKPRVERPFEISPQVRAGLNAYAVRKLYGRVLLDCDRRLHDGKDVYGKSMRQWVGIHSADLKMGTRAMFATLAQENHPYHLAVDEHAALLSKQLQGELGSSVEDALSAEQCGKATASFQKH